MSAARSGASQRETAYTAGTVVLAAVATALTVVYSPVPAWYQLVGFALAAFLLGSRTVRLSRTIGTVSVGFVFVFAALVELGPLGAVIAAAASALGGTLLHPARGIKLRPIVVACAVSNIVLAAAAAGWAFVRLDPVCTDTGLTLGILPAFIVIGVYFLINSLGVALMVSVQAGRSPLAIWSDSLSWTVLPFYFGGAAVIGIHLVGAALGPTVWFAVIPASLFIHGALELRTRVQTRATQPAAEQVKA